MEQRSAPWLEKETETGEDGRGTWQGRVSAGTCLDTLIDATHDGHYA